MSISPRTCTINSKINYGRICPTDNDKIAGEREKYHIT